MGRFLLSAILLTLPLTAAAQISSQNVAERRAQLERDLASLEEEIDQQRKILEDRQRQTVTLERDLAILNAKIERARLSIKARNLVIQRLSHEISAKETTIEKLSAKLDRERQSLAQVLRKTNKIDSFSLAEVVLSNRDLSDFFEDINSFNAIKEALRDSFALIEATKTETETEKEILEEKRREELELRTLQELEKRRAEEQEAEKKKILKISRGVEAEYQKIIASKQLDAVKIRSELFTLRGSAAIPFERALQYALRASAKTGVRPALLLGVIAEESNLGENVGSGNWRVDMKNPRDTQPFLDITRRLGLDPDRMPVSKRAWYGFGGAMGPAQFIPSTWLLYETRVANATGHNPPNPWDPGDAFMAAALLLADNGAETKTAESERLAALRYLAGWKNARKRAYAFYGDDVMELAEKYQRQIEILEGNGTAQRFN